MEKVAEKGMHTKGPWIAAADRMVLGRAFDGSLKAIADRVRGGTPAEADANASLIASAPDLLASVKELVASYDGIRDQIHGSVVKGKLARADAAISKAEQR